MSVKQVQAAPAIAVSGLDITFSTLNGPVKAVQDVHVEIEKGGFTSLIGPSGCGKSTLLRAIADLIPPSSGEISVLGKEVPQARRDRDIGFVFQDAALLPWRTVIENVRLPLEIGKGKKSSDHAMTPVEALELVGLGGRMEAYPHELSGGMRQRVSIARALVIGPRVLLMDEPFGALDEITRDNLNEELLRIWQAAGITVVFVTHSIQEAVFLSQKVIVMAANPGRITQVVDVPMGYPRDLAVRDSAEFTEVARTLRHALAAGGQS